MEVAELIEDIMRRFTRFLPAEVSAEEARAVLDAAAECEEIFTFDRTIAQWYVNGRWGREYREPDYRLKMTGPQRDSAKLWIRNAWQIGHDERAKQMQGVTAK